MTWEGWLKTAVVVGFGAKIVADILRGPPKLTAWAMFTQALFCRLDVRTEDGEPVDQWQHIANKDPLMDVATLDEFLEYLDVVHGIAPSGSAVLISGAREDVVAIEEGAIVRRRPVSTDGR